MGKSIFKIEALNKVVQNAVKMSATEAFEKSIKSFEFYYKNCAMDAPKKRDGYELFGRWEVNSINGDMIFNSGRYFIDGDRLKEKDWICHLEGKVWINWGEFIPAYLYALRVRKIKELSIQIYI